MDIMFAIFLSIFLSLPIYIYLAFGADKKPYLVSVVTLFCVLVVIQITVYTLTNTYIFGEVFLIPLALQSIVILIATYLGRKKGFVRYGL